MEYSKEDLMEAKKPVRIVAERAVYPFTKKRLFRAKSTTKERKRDFAPRRERINR